MKIPQFTWIRKLTHCFKKKLSQIGQVLTPWEAKAEEFLEQGSGYNAYSEMEDYSLCKRWMISDQSGPTK